MSVWGDLRQIAYAGLCSLETLRATYDLTRITAQAGTPGDFVECGVFGGANAAAMALALMNNNVQGRRVHLFDSFEGIPEAGPHDQTWTHPKGTSACSMEAVQSMMKQWGIDESLLVYHPGWFAATVPWCWRGENKIAILRLDADLYESTRVCIENLYPLVSPGGWIIVDDFALPGCRKAVDDFMKGNYPPVYWQKP